MDGSNILSGPLGTGLVTVGGLPLDAAGNARYTAAVAASIEAVGGPQTLANDISLIIGSSNLAINAMNLTSSLIVQGSENLTLSGVISSDAVAPAGGGITKDGAATLTLTGMNTYLGNTTVDGGGSILVQLPRRHSLAGRWRGCVSHNRLATRSELSQLARH